MTRGYFNNQSANKTEKKAEDLKFEIWFAGNRDVHMRLQIFKVSLNKLSYEKKLGLYFSLLTNLVLKIFSDQSFK